MPTPKGYTSSEKDDRLRAEFVTITPIGLHKYALDVIDKGPCSEAATDAVDSASTSVITASSHVARIGDRIRFTSGTYQGFEVDVVDVDTNTITMGQTLATAPSAADTFSILRPTSLTLSASGGITTANTFIRDGSNQIVTEDTVTPANNRPLPVKLTDVTGDLTITAQNLNVQLTHAGANPDSVQIGDGTETVAVNASNEMQIADDTARTSLATIAGDTTSLDTKLPAQGAALTAASTPVNIASDQTVPISAVSLPLPTGAATEATLSSIDTDTSTIAGDTTSIDGKTPALGAAVTASSTPVNIASDQTVPISAVSLPLPTGAATEATLSTLNGKVTAVDTDNVTISVALPAGTNNIGDVDVVSSALPTGAATEATLASIDGNITACDTGNVTISAALPAGTNNIGDVDIASALPAGSNTIGAVDLNRLDVVDFLDTPLLDASSTNIPASASTPVTVVASLAAAVQKIQFLETTGNFIGIYSDPAGSPVLEAIIGPGSDQTIEVSLASTTVLGLRNMENSTITTGNVAINFLG